jgi:predicted secreted acid phosphatase
MRLTRRGTATVAVAAAALTAISIAGPANAAPKHPSDDHLTPNTQFVMEPDGSSGLTAGGAGIPNIDSVKSTIRAYYNATSAGIANKTTSPYITEIEQIEAAALAKLPKVKPSAKKAIVFDSDDTTLWTYDMEDGAMHFNFNPALQDVWVQNKLFPATPGMVDFVDAVVAKGYTVFGVTGRGAAQKQATIENLDDLGYQGFTDDRFFTKWAAGQQPSYVTCAAASCTTVEFKANTRKHIENDLGYDIALNVGDQFSDLQGGYSDSSLKLPNPTYYLPSADLPGLKEPKLAPRTHFTMNADGSSGLTAGGEGIPNIDSVKSTIRAYYNADSTGIANKTSSPYISEITKLSKQVTNTYVNQCRQMARKGEKPAIVFDADDTTLWTYDMEDNAMHFNFDPVLQNDPWVQQGLFPATPGMVSLVNAVGEAGCTVVGLTGRNDAQKDATLANLAKVGYTQFTAENYYTKFVKGSTPPAYFDGTPCQTGTCTTIQYKSAVRAHVEAQGYDIIGNFGDQFSDLIGGHADSTVKLPNPTYYLP